MTNVENREINQRLDKLNEGVTELRTLVGLEAKLCPFRETIVIASNDHERLFRLEDKVRANSLNIAKMLGSGILGGGVVAIVQAIWG